METIIFDHISVKPWAFTGTLGWQAIQESDWITTRRQPIKYLRLFNWTFWNLLLYTSILRALSLTVSILASWNRTRQDPRKKSKICHFVLGNDTQRFQGTLFYLIVWFAYIFSSKTAFYSDDSVACVPKTSTSSPSAQSHLVEEKFFANLL